MSGSCQYLICDKFQGDLLPTASDFLATILKIIFGLWRGKSEGRSFIESEISYLDTTWYWCYQEYLGKHNHYNLITATCTTCSISAVFNVDGAGMCTSTLAVFLLRFLSLGGHFFKVSQNWGSSCGKMIASRLKICLIYLKKTSFLCIFTNLFELIFQSAGLILLNSALEEHCT